MAQLNDLLKSDFLKNPIVRNTAIGIGVAVLVPIVAKSLAPLVRPVARSTLKIGVVTYEKGRETLAEFGEILDDMVAEVREELRAERDAAEDTELDELAADKREPTAALDEGSRGTGSV
jgi:predicted HTH domain antitoxin